MVRAISQKFSRWYSMGIKGSSGKKLQRRGYEHCGIFIREIIAPKVYGRRLMGALASNAVVR